MVYRLEKVRFKGNTVAARTGHSACIALDKWQNPHMYIVGGRRKVEKNRNNLGGKPGILATERSNDIYIYDVNSNTWTNPVLTNANLHTKSYPGTALAFDHSLLVFCTLITIQSPMKVWKAIIYNYPC